MRDAEVERAAEDRAARRQRPVVAEVLPQPERDRRQLQAAAAAAAVTRSARSGPRPGRTTADRARDRTARLPSIPRCAARRRTTRLRRVAKRATTASTSGKPGAPGLAIWIVTGAMRIPYACRVMPRGTEARVSARLAVRGRHRRHQEGTIRSHAPHSPAERPRSAVDAERRRPRRPGSDRRRQSGLRRQRLQPRDPAPAAAEGRLPPAAARRSRAARRSTRRWPTRSR